MVLMLFNAIMASVAAIGFSIIFKVPTRFLKIIALMSFFGFLTREYSMFVGFGIEMSTLMAAIVIGVLGGYFSGKLKVPAQVLTVSSAVPMIPGTISFKAIQTLIEFISQKDPSPLLLTSFIYLSAKAIFILGALAFGITVFTMLLRK